MLNLNVMMYLNVMYGSHDWNAYLNVSHGLNVMHGLHDSHGFHDFHVHLNLNYGNYVICENYVTYDQQKHPSASGFQVQLSLYPALKAFYQGYFPLHLRLNFLYFSETLEKVHPYYSYIFTHFPLTQSVL